MIPHLHMKYKMKHRKKILMIIFTGLLCSGCKKNSPSFLFWCVRPEVVTKDIFFSDVDFLKSLEKDKSHALLEEDFKKIEGFVSSKWDLVNNSVKISYKSSHSRLMNYERIFHNHNIKIIHKNQNQ